MRLGCIADDLTGASDLALMLSREGLKTVQTIGVPDATLDLSAADAVVVALKSRTLPGQEAVTQSIAAAARYSPNGRPTTCGRHRCSISAAAHTVARARHPPCTPQRPGRRRRPRR